MTADPADAARPTWRVLGRVPGGRIGLVDLDAAGGTISRQDVAPEDLAPLVAASEEEGPLRWVWSDTPTWYDRLLRDGVRIDRCHDLRLTHRILENSQLVADPEQIRAEARWGTSPLVPIDARPAEATLFDIDAPSTAQTVPHELDAALAELERQRDAIEASRDPGRLRLLLAAESAGALIAAELHAAGVPWDVAEHDRILSEALGPRPRPGHAPERMAEAAAEVREALGDPQVSLDSHPKLLRALHRAGIDVASTSQWELQEKEHPAIEPLLRYKKLSRLLTANGWSWIDEWVDRGRYRPLYVPGGVVTGRWAASGGGALQIPRLLRPALRADPGWRLVSADVSQLEPRVLAAMARDEAMAQAGAGTDLYAGIVETGIVTTRQEAKIAVLGGLYGGTAGDSGRLVPRLRQTFPDALALVDDAARVGEKGGTVSTFLGRSSPPPEAAWLQAQQQAHGPDADPAEGERARRSARDRGRFTRNFVVQGTAAEWALAWMADLRQRLHRFEQVPEGPIAEASGPVFSRRAHLVFFLHDEVIVHAPAAQAEAAAEAIRAAADAAGRLLFPGSPVDFPLDLAITERAGKD